jgi:hypothetical protein
LRVLQSLNIPFKFTTAVYFYRISPVTDSKIVKIKNELSVKFARTVYMGNKTILQNHLLLIEQNYSCIRFSSNNHGTIPHGERFYLLRSISQSSRKRYVAS